MEQWGAQHGLGDQGHHWLHANGLTLSLYAFLVAERALVSWVTTQDPETFGLPWHFPGEVALDEALHRQACAVGLVQPEASFPPRRAVYERRVLRAWASTYGVTLPPAQMATELAQTAARFPVDAAWLTTQGWTLAHYQQWLRDWSLVAWITQQGPAHFGQQWAFEGALLHACQITGRTAHLGQGRQDD